MISKKPSIQYIWEFPLTIKTNTIKQSGRITFWSKGKNLLYKRKIGHTAGVAQVSQPHFNMIGLFKRPQTNRKDNEKGMQFGCQQPLLLGGALRDSPKNGCEGD